MSVFAPGNTALITGGANGIGLAVAQLCREHGMKVAVVDVSNDHLSRAKDTLANGNPEEVVTYNADVSRLEQWKELKSKFESRFGEPDLLMLNAGIGLKGTWGDDEYFHKIVDTNLFGVINGLNTFVGSFQSRKPKRSAIVITGSKQGITNPPGNPAYNASKAAVKALAEHLSYDLKDTQTSVHLLVPGWTFTGLTGGGLATQREKPDGAWTPEQVAQYLQKKMDAGSFYIICPDNDVSEEMDKKRMLWAAGDIVNDRPPLTRWRKEHAQEHEEWMKSTSVT